MGKTGETDEWQERQHDNRDKRGGEKERQTDTYTPRIETVSVYGGHCPPLSAKWETYMYIFLTGKVLCVCLSHSF